MKTFAIATFCFLLIMPPQKQKPAQLESDAEVKPEFIQEKKTEGLYMTHPGQLRPFIEQEIDGAVYVIAYDKESGWALAESSVLGFLQKPEKVILQEVPFNGKDPLEITEIKVKGIERKAGESFAEDGEWFNDTTFKLTNTYSKPIVYLQINVNFPDVVSKKVPGAILQHQILLGRHPEYKSDERPELLIMPGNSIEVSFASEYERISRMIAHMKTSINNINKIVIRLSEAAFNDDTLYSGGRMHERNPDPNGRPKWLQIKQ